MPSPKPTAAHRAPFDAGPDTVPATSSTDESAPDAILPYKNTGDRELVLHLFEPPSVTGAARPCILLIHGGGWVSNGPERYHRFARTLRDQGFLAACLQYRLANPPSTVRVLRFCTGHGILPHHRR